MTLDRVIFTAFGFLAGFYSAILLAVYLVYRECEDDYYE